MRMVRVQRRMRLLVLALALLMFTYSLSSGLPSTFASVSDMLASAVVSLSASVNPNPDNTLAAQLRERESELAMREAALAEPVPATDWGLYSFILSVSLMLLLAINYLFDWRRSRRPLVT